jgi:GAF domain-containing protein
MSPICEDPGADPWLTAADLRRRLDERTAELDEVLTQQTATAEVLQVINSSHGDLAPVFDAMLEKATGLCDAPLGTLWLFDGEHMNPVATRGTPQGLADFLHRGPHKPNPVQQRQLHGEGTIHLVDLKGTALYRNGDPLARAVADLGGIQTVLSVPLSRKDQVLGLFGVCRPETRPFSEKQIALIENFAAQAVIAIENARLLTETREALEQQTATAEVLQVINSSPGELAPDFDTTLEKATRLAEASFGILMTYDGESFHTVALYGVPRAYAEYLRTPIHPGPLNGLGRLLGGERLIHIADITADKAYTAGDPLRKATAELGGSRTHLLVPLLKEGSLLGTFVIYRQEVRPFSDKQIALLQNFAAQAVIAMENARLQRPGDLPRIRRRYCQGLPSGRPRHVSGDRGLCNARSPPGILRPHGCRECRFESVYRGLLPDGLRWPSRRGA